jgi:hypothetical protein
VAREKLLEKDDQYYAADTRALADADQNARDARELQGGDATMLGATQVNMAKELGASGTRSHSSRSGRTGSSAVSSIDAARAAELDHLVDAGDWEGVVLAAAKFEASEEGSRGKCVCKVWFGYRHSGIEIHWRKYWCCIVRHVAVCLGQRESQQAAKACRDSC